MPGKQPKKTDPDILQHSPRPEPEHRKKANAPPLKSEEKKVDPVQEALEESFPASDPPSYNKTAP